MFQKCPICNGTGQDFNFPNLNSACTVCKGAKIIDDKSGKPPTNTKDDSTTPLNLKPYGDLGSIREEIERDEKAKYR